MSREQAGTKDFVQVLSLCCRSRLAPSPALRGRRLQRGGQQPGPALLRGTPGTRAVAELLKVIVCNFISLQRSGLECPK